ncbi:MAG: hypothetical protein DWQ18_07070 [Crenarchaeota archaeon]|nr:MAG: hypothetical protein DWQ17_02715 [Thermoproteota archaeon]RDJ32939.1 MAG: hypothetical protein DWQ18_07070 [Thermoproteota archaeon]RDJ35980.1 MAG: hypothetical protein DWQ13_08800 [Thermoproteota archaeon]RDJ38225.1 MAG: hypothetical protein DWQ19_00105 [Thermoproteota archaeon]
MKTLLVLLIIFTTVSPAFAAPLSDRTGLKQDFIIETGGYEFEVETVSNFDVNKINFDAEGKRLTLTIDSGLENNLAEIYIPKNLINGNFTFFLNDVEIFPKVQTSEQISFITLEFVGTGKHTLDIIGTTYLPEFSEIAPLVLATGLIGLLFLKKRSLIK